MNVGDAAHRSGLPAKTIRYYEEIGLIAPARAASGYRDYSGDDIHRLAFLRRARNLGFSIDDCRTSLMLQPCGRCGPARWPCRRTCHGDQQTVASACPQPRSSLPNFCNRPDCPMASCRSSMAIKKSLMASWTMRPFKAWALSAPPRSRNISTAVTRLERQTRACASAGGRVDKSRYDNRSDRWRKRAMRRRRWRPSRNAMSWTLIAAAIAILASLIAVKAGPPLVGCSIKGNISHNTGERIYHVPGQQYYDETRISLWKGERWFCSEQEARKAGWRKSKL